MREDKAQSEQLHAAIAENVEAAHAAQLRYVSDSDPGIARKRTGKGFRYQIANGKTHVDDRTLSRIRSLAIPPAWTNVWICADSNGHIQATGRDDRGRKQYRYHPDWSQARGDVKFSSLAEFARALPRLRRQIEADLRRHGLARERVIASIVWLLDNAMIRIGNAAYARDNSSFGLTTLRNRHVDIEGATLRFAFKGKSGKEWRLKLVDRRMARVVRSIQELPGQRLFQYVDADGVRSGVTSQDVNDYIRQASKAPFSSKHFRTWGATVRALALFGKTPVPDSDRGRTQMRNEVIDDVARHLGNTRSVCRKGYIHPAVISSWSEGRLLDEIAACRPLRNGELDRDERRALAWLARLEKAPAKQRARRGSA